MAGVHGNEEYLRRLKVGDVIGYEARDFFVRGSLRFDQEGYTWAEHLISDGEVQHWLSVEDDEGITVVLWQRVGRGELDGEPGSPTVHHDQTSFSLHEDGEASFVAEGTTGTAPSGTARYADYRGPDGRLCPASASGRAGRSPSGARCCRGRSTSSRSPDELGGPAPAGRLLRRQRRRPPPGPRPASAGRARDPHRGRRRALPRPAHPRRLPPGAGDRRGARCSARRRWRAAREPGDRTTACPGGG
jgi:hypothetical protein